MNLVLDTNIIVSAFITPNGNPSKILKLVLQKKASFYYNTAILQEYEKVMLRPKFSAIIKPEDIHKFLKLLCSIGTPFDPVPSKIKFSDESDRIFYDTAKGSNSFLITGNIKHYPKESFILLPVDLLQKIS